MKNGTNRGMGPVEKGFRQDLSAPVRYWWARGIDIQALGILFLASGVVDFFWILAYPDYALVVFGQTFPGSLGQAVKFQHPIIHWIIGMGFLGRRRWAYWAYLLYLALACASETVTQISQGFHPLRTTLVLFSLLFAAYVIARRRVFA